MSVVDLPEELVPLSWLIGRWAGVGLGQYPTIEDFRFGQEVSFTTDGRPFLAYASRSWLLNDDGEKVRPLATETGYWRPRPDGSLEVTMAHPTGYAELWLGTAEVLGIENATITSARATMTSDVIAASPSAKPYTAGERLYGLVNGELMWTYDMAAVEQPLTNHLSARLRPAE
ncbi:MAG: FABP family protein [Candidatus Nanopelagicales bacterium]